MKFALIFCILFFTFSNCTVINPIRKSPYKTFQANITNQPFDVIIVPGIPYNSKKWSSIMHYRMLWAKFLFDKGYTKNIIFSGGAVYTPYIESKIMALYGEALNIPKKSIYTEEKAEHSTENVYYSYYLAKKLGFNNIALATDPYQTNNLNKYIIKNNFDIKILPIQYDTVLLMNIQEPLIDPTTALTDKSFQSIKDRESFFKRLRGTMGKNINYTEEDKKRRGSRKKQEQTN